MTSKRRRGLYVALEGIDGSGKSTLLPALARRLRRDGFSVRLRREPASSELGHHAQRAGARNPWIGAIYFTIDRYLARPALERDLRAAQVVLSDRSFWSTIAYQGSALPPSDRRRLRSLQDRATSAPDLVLLLELPPEEALKRVGARKTARSPLERIRTLRRVARAYRALSDGDGWARLDARSPVAQNADAAARLIRNRLRRPRGPRA